MELQLRLIEMLQKEDLYEAVYWAKKLRLPQHKIHPFVVKKLTDIESGLDDFPAEAVDDFSDSCATTNNCSVWGAAEWDNVGWDSSNTSADESIVSQQEKSNSSEVFQLPLPKSSIVFVDDNRGILRLVNYIKQNKQVSKLHLL